MSWKVRPGNNKKERDTAKERSGRKSIPRSDMQWKFSSAPVLKTNLRLTTQTVDEEGV